MQISDLTKRVAKFMSEIKSKIKIKDAVKYKITTKKGHRFKDVPLPEPTYCSQCDRLIWGLVGQSCQLCNMACHRDCLDQVENHCKRSRDPEECFKGTVNCKPHIFESTYFFKPTFCNHCGTLLVGVISPQGAKCESKKGGCGMVLHNDAEKNCTQLVDPVCAPRKSQETLITRNDQDDYIGGLEDVQKWSRISLEDFELVKLVGEGSFGKVYLANLKGVERQSYAIKVIKKTMMEVVCDIGSVFTEAAVERLGRDCQFLVVGHCCFQTRDRLFFVMDYIAGHDLRYHIDKSGRFWERRARFYAAEIFIAIKFLHHKGFVYRDLSPKNVIIDAEGHCKLIDFGMTKDLSACDGKTRTFCGTVNYISPEVIREFEYNHSVDWWCFGMLIFEMLTGDAAFGNPEDPWHELERSIIEDELVLPSQLSYDARSIIGGLLTKNPEERLGCQLLDGLEEAIEVHSFFKFETDTGKNYRWDDIANRRLEPPYRPTEEELDDLSELPSLTPICESVLNKVPQGEFKNFSYYSESFMSQIATRMERI